MRDRKTTTYTEAQYKKLKPEQKEALHEVGKYLTGEEVTSADDETLALTFGILRPCDGCIPEEEIGDDLLAAIRRKFACVYYAATERAEKKLKAQGLRFYDDHAFCLVVDPCYENSTHVAVVDLRPEMRPFCYFHDYSKAWHFSFANLKDIAREVLRAEKIILCTYQGMKKHHSVGRRKL